jgi:CBS domain containing-hemolysin-like protein
MTTAVILGACLLVAALLTAAETALAGVDRAEVARRAKAGDRTSRTLLELVEHPERLLATTWLGMYGALAIAASLLVYTLTTRAVASVAWVVVGTLVPVQLLFARLLPRALARAHAHWWSAQLARPIWLVSIVLTPASLLLRGMASLVGKALRVDERQGLVRRQELRALLDAPANPTGGGISEGERTMIARIFELSDTTVYDVMVPLSEVTALPDDGSLEDALREFDDKQHTRIPVYRERIDQIIGVVHAFDALAASSAGTAPSRGDTGAGQSSVPLAALARPPLFVPETALAVDVLAQLQRAGQGMAIVVDEYGGATGVITAEDILEEVVGEIEDEYDRLDPPLIHREAPGLYRIEAKAGVAKVNATLRTELPEGEDYESIAGLLLHHLKRIPRVGDVLRLPSATITVTRGTERAVEEVRIQASGPRWGWSGGLGDDALSGPRGRVPPPASERGTNPGEPVTGVGTGQPPRRPPGSRRSRRG